jgi:predicted Zn-ribbon and HTH transcriptional regulator
MVKKSEVIVKCKCLKCGKEWWPRTPTKPNICPRCKSVHWEQPKKNDSD